VPRNHLALTPVSEHGPILQRHCRMHHLAVLVAGFGVAWLGAWWSAHLAQETLRQERRHAADEKGSELSNIRVLLHLELQHNLDKVRDLHHALFDNREGEEIEFVAEARFITVTLPAWGHLMFDALAARLPEAMTPDIVTRVYSLYWSLERLTTLQQTLSASQPANLISDFFAWHADNTQALLRGSGSSVTTWARYQDFKAFEKSSASAWRECNGIINDAMRGNPVPEQ
jgi:hypothetical protein